MNKLLLVAVLVFSMLSAYAQQIVTMGIQDAGKLGGQPYIWLSWEGGCGTYNLQYADTLNSDNWITVWIKNRLASDPTSATEPQTDLRPATGSGGSTRYYRMVFTPISEPGYECPGTLIQWILEPSDVQVYIGDWWCFSVEVRGPIGITYQWRKNGVPIPGATKKDWILDRSALTDAGTYDCILTTPGGTTATSRAAAFSVVGPEPLTLEVSSTYTTEPHEFADVLVTARRFMHVQRLQYQVQWFEGLVFAGYSDVPPSLSWDTTCTLDYVNRTLTVVTEKYITPDCYPTLPDGTTLLRLTFRADKSSHIQMTCSPSDYTFYHPPYPSPYQTGVMAGDWYDWRGTSTPYAPLEPPTFVRVRHGYIGVPSTPPGTP